MAFDRNTDIRRGDLFMLEMIKNNPAAIKKCIAGLLNKDDEYSRGMLGVLMEMLDYLNGQVPPPGAYKMASKTLSMVAPGIAKAGGALFAGGGLAAFGSGLLIGTGIGAGILALGAAILGIKSHYDIKKKEEAEQRKRLAVLRSFVWFLITAGMAIIFEAVLKTPLPLPLSILIAVAIGSVCTWPLSNVRSIIFTVIFLGITAGLTALCVKFNLSPLPLPVLVLLNFFVLIIALSFLLEGIKYLIPMLILMGAGTFLFTRFLPGGLTTLTLFYIAFAMSFICMRMVMAFVQSEYHPERFYRFIETCLFLVLNAVTSIVFLKVFAIPFPMPVTILVITSGYGLIFILVRLIRIRLFNGVRL